MSFISSPFFIFSVKPAIIAIIVILTGFSVRANISPDIYTFNQISIEEGLSQSTVVATAQDADGFIWIGTRDGLNKYDSRKFVVYKHDPEDKNSLSANSIYCLLTDSKGTLWVGTGNGLNVYSPAKDNFKRIYHHSDDQSITSNSITCLFEDRDKNIWIGTRQGLNVLVSGDSLQFHRFLHSDDNENSLVHNYVRCIYQDRQGDLWIGTANGISKLAYNHPEDYQFTSFTPRSLGFAHQLDNLINAFSEDHNGSLLIGTEKEGIQLLDQSTGKAYAWEYSQKTDINTESVRVIQKDEWNNYWIGTVDGLHIIHPKEGSFVKLNNQPNDPTSLSDNSILSLFVDKSGTFWIGTFYGGINTYNPLSKQFHTFTVNEKGPGSRFKVASQLVKNAAGDIWLATDGNGLFFKDASDNKVKHYKNIPDDPGSLNYDKIKCLLLEEGKGLWVGTLKGLSFLDFATHQFVRYPRKARSGRLLYDDKIYDLLKDQQGRLWIASYNAGLCYLDAPANHFVPYIPSDPTPIALKNPTYLFEDSKQNVWVGSGSGLHILYRNEKKLKPFEIDQAGSAILNSSFILCIKESSTGVIWVGTRGKGLFMINPEADQLKNIMENHGLSGNTIFGMLEDDSDHVWVSTENGLSRMNPENFAISVYDKSDGLACKEFSFNSSHRDDDGYMYFGGYNGLVVFHPDSIRANKRVPPLAFTKISLFNKGVQIGAQNGLLQQSINKTDHLTFHHNQNVFSIEFAALNFINPEKNQYAYKLKGFEDEWNYVKEPIATYMNLNRGNYTLLIKGSNNDGLWNDTPLAISITVLPPPWKSWWAYSLYTLVFFTLLYIWTRFYRTRVQLEHKLEIEHLEMTRQQELHQSKLNFFNNIAHEIRTPLTLVISPIEHMMQKYVSDPFLQKQLSIVTSNTNRLLRLLSQLLDFHKQETGNVPLKITEGNIVQLLKEIQNSFRGFADSRKIEFAFQCDHEKINADYDPAELEKAFYNLLANAFKFTPSGGKVSIKLHLESGKEMVKRNMADFVIAEDQTYIKIIIEDNGLGISPQHLTHIFHRFYQAEHSGIHEAGFGIGLALTKGIIDLHQGHINVESREATQTTSGFTRFTVFLPVHGVHYEKEAYSAYDSLPVLPLMHPEYIEGPEKTVTPKVCEKGKQGKCEKPQVLIIEDNTEIRAYLKNILNEKYEVLEAANGKYGWEVATEKLPDIILSDIVMPEMSGLELVSKLKKDERTDHIPVLLLTARGSLSNQLEGFNRGADDYISKPFNIQMLMLKIGNRLVTREKLKEKFKRIVTLQPQFEEVKSPEDRFLQKLMDILESHVSDPDFNVSQLVMEIGMSRPVLFRKIKMLTGLSVIDLIKSVRLKKAEMLLKQNKLSIAEVAFHVGFNDPKYFSKSFRSHFGKTPSQYAEDNL